MHLFHDFAIDTVIYPAGLVMPRHDHPWTNVTAVIRGEILEQTDSAEHRGRSCSVVFKPAGTIHANRAIGPGPVVTIAIELRGGSELSWLAAERPWSWMEGHETARAAFRLQEMIRTSPDHVEAAAQSLLAVVLTPLQQRPQPPWLAEILEIVERDPAEPLNLQMIARRVGLHPAYVSRAFRRMTGRTLTGYVRDLRLGRARHLLSTTARPLLGVAADCGFTDASHLSRAFAGAHAVTPGAFGRSVTRQVNAVQHRHAGRCYVRIMPARLTALAAFVLVTGCASAPPDPAAADIVSFTEQVMRDVAVTPSLAVAVVRDGKPFLVRGFGRADIEGNVPAEARTAYYIASSTKSYVGLLAAVLAHRGTIELDAPITRYLPELKMPEGVEPQRVTMRTLLTHTAGLQSPALVARTAYTGEHSPELLLDLVSRSRVRKSEFAYDNYGYVVASLVLERVTGKRWQDLLDQIIFEPAGMRHTTAYMSETREWPMAVPYASSLDGLERQRMMKTDQTMHAAGGIVTTAEDLLRWLELNINRGRIGGVQVLPAEAFDLAHRQQATLERKFGAYRRYGYGLGWYWSDYEGQTMLHHFGGFEGWRAHVSFMPDRKTGVAVVTNTAGLGFDVPDLIANYIYDRLGDRPDLAAMYAARVKELRDSVDKEREGMRKHLAERAARKSMLLHDPDAYAGTYRNRDLGDVTIRRSGTELRATIGQLEGAFEPYTEPESARIELIPGSGEVFRFEFGDGPKAIAFQWRGERFERVD